MKLEERVQISSLTSVILYFTFFEKYDIIFIWANDGMAYMGVSKTLVERPMGSNPISPTNCILLVFALKLKLVLEWAVAKW